MSPTSSATTESACSPTTARSPARPCASGRARRSSCGSATTATTRPPSTGTASASTTSYDGVPDETQAPIPVGGEFTYRLRFPDDGVYWYHPHVREDYGLEMGLYGNILVDPADARRWPPVNREAIVTLDDVLIEDGRIAPFQIDGPTHTAMGRFGNVMLTGGSTDLRLDARAGEVVRFFFTNTANTRIFNVAIPGARMKLSAATADATSTRSASTACCSPPPSGPSSTSCSPPRLVPAGAPHPRPAPTGSARSTFPSRRRQRSFIAEFEALHSNQDARAANASASTQHLQRRPDKTLIFDRRDADPLRPRGRRPAST